MQRDAKSDKWVVTIAVFVVMCGVVMLPSSRVEAGAAMWKHFMKQE